MSTRTATIHTRIQPNLKFRAEQIFAESGHTTSDVLEQFYIQTVRSGKVPIRLNKRRATIPDEALMSDKEIKLMLSAASKSARKQISEVNLITSNDIKVGLKRQHGVEL